ncbi:pyruvate kinase Pyk [Variovorax paradoxus B4]|uniref:Pyruvate kinase n=1 Tax=Variovorax paradoxus B4 TaxID=1246301 RepID=T1XHB8_VARPD|nr:pyruvate kinase [Variovorax paradoxus]AGU51724.1 pyruvate kinase Pyk [Variovorax paradoxus B4]
MRRTRSAKIVATLGPATSDEPAIRALFERGVDVFRLNFSHGTQHDHARRLDTIRRLEKEFGRPIGVLLDLQGPKLRLGTFEGGRAQLDAGAHFRLDMDATSGNARRAPLLHPEIFAALQVGTDLLLDDGKLRLRVDSYGADFAETTVLVGGPISDRKGVNVPSVVLPISPLTPKDLDDLACGLAMGVDWVALSFVQRPEDIEEARAIIGKRAWIMAKLEKPAAIDHLDAIVDLCDGVMVARGDLGVELPPERVPELQRLIVRACRKRGKPVVVATQMLESMIAAPVPTRAEVSDVATAVYDGVDAVMLSAESASGKYPLEAVAMMDRIISRVEADASYRIGIDATHEASLSTTADAVCASMRQVAALLAPAATVTYTSSGFTSLRAARERPAVPILSLTPDVATARRMAMVWGVHAVLVDDVHDVAEMIERACRNACTEGFASSGNDVVVVAGLPFGLSGTTNLLHVARIP